MEAHVYRKTIDAETFFREQSRLRESLCAARIERGDLQIEEMDVEAVLGFGDHVLTNAARISQQLDADQKRRFQAVLFPEGLPFDGEGFGTAATCPLFGKLQPSRSRQERMVSPTGFEPVSPA